ncbi:MAG: TrkH family potassium uptake protein [Alphaproteobacteria bacterium]
MIPKLGAVFYVVGILLMPLGLVMTLPAIVDGSAGNPDWEVYLIAAGVTVFLGGMLVLANRRQRFSMDRRQAFLLTTLSWIILPAFAALPFSFARLELSYSRAYFEAMSGLTATGATTLIGLDDLPAGILLWRAILQGFGGAGIILLALAVLPFLRVGGMQLFRLESSEQGEKVLPRATQIAAMTVSVYLGLVLLSIIAYWAAGMSFFDAVCHGLTTVSTGGFSTHDASIGFYDSVPIEAVCALFMFLGGVPIVLVYRLLLRFDWRAFVMDQQVRLFLTVVIAGIVALGVWRILGHGVDPGISFRWASFTVISFVTTTAHANVAYQEWGSFADVLLLFAMLLGACSGSTSGGIKMFRFSILIAVMKAHFRRLEHPHAAVNVTYNKRTVSDGIAQSALLLLLSFLLAFVVVALAISAFGYDLLTSLSAAASAIGNAGGGLGPIITNGYFGTMPEGAIWILSAAMLLGRLELFTVLILLAPRFWRG